MKKGILVCLLIGVLCVGPALAADHGPWAVGVQAGYLTGIGISGSYDTLTAEVGAVFWGGSSVFGFGARWFYPHPVSDTVKLGPGVAVSGVLSGSGNLAMSFGIVWGLECRFAKRFAFTTQLGYPNLILELNQQATRIYVEHSAVPLLATLSLGVKYYF